LKSVKKASITGELAREQDCKRLSNQIEFNRENFGAHQIQNLDKSSLNQFMRYCPEARVMLK
jgi:hypothetical protein